MKKYVFNTSMQLCVQTFYWYHTEIPSQVAFDTEKYVTVMRWQ